MLEVQTENVNNPVDTGEYRTPKRLEITNKKHVLRSGLNRSNLTVLPKPSDFEKEKETKKRERERER